MRGREDAFTIVELIVTIGIFGVAIVALIQLFSAVQTSQRNARYDDLAAQAARAEIETLRATQAGTLTNGQTINFSSSLPSSMPSGSTSTVIVSTPANAPLAKQLDVTVSFGNGSLTRQVTLTAYVDPPGGT